MAETWNVYTTRGYAIPFNHDQIPVPVYEAPIFAEAKLVQWKWLRYMVRAACSYDGCSQVSAEEVAKIHGEGSM